MKNPTHKPEKKEDYRYQFLKFDSVKTGKWYVPKEVKGRDWSGGILGGFGNFTYEITEEVAFVFDKKTGKVKQVKVDELYKLQEKK